MQGRFRFLIKRSMLLSLFAKSGESGRVVDGDVCKNLAVKVDTCDFQTVNERAVRHIVNTSGCIDTSNPKFAEIAFLALRPT